MKSAGIPLALLLSALVPVIALADEPAAPPRADNPAAAQPPTPPAQPPAVPVAASPLADPNANPDAPKDPVEPKIPHSTSGEHASPDMSGKLNTVMPKFAPGTALAVPPAANPVPPADPDTVELPKLTVKQKPRPRLSPEIVMNTKAFNEQLAKQNLSSFDRDFLNKFTLPSWFGGQSAADRAREEYDRKKKEEMKEDVDTIAKAVEVTDPAQAKALRDAAAKP